MSTHTESRHVHRSVALYVLAGALALAIVLAGCAPRTAEPTATPVVIDQATASAVTAAPATLQPTTTSATVAPATVAPATVAPAATVETPEVKAVATVSRVLTTVAPTAAVGVVSGEGEVELEDFQFRPQVLTVRVGTVVKFSNKDEAVHTVTSDTGLFESGSLSKGDDFFYTFTEVGEYPYYCAPHGGPGGQGMSGRIIVVP